MKHTSSDWLFEKETSEQLFGRILKEDLNARCKVLGELEDQARRLWDLSAVTAQLLPTPPPSDHIP